MGAWASSCFILEIVGGFFCGSLIFSSFGESLVDR